MLSLDNAFAEQEVADFHRRVTERLDLDGDAALPIPPSQNSTVRPSVLFMSTAAGAWRNPR